MHTVLEEVANMENHAELISGNLVITDVATITHQRAVSAIRRALEQYIESSHDECEVFTSNTGLFCSELCDLENNFFLPDIMVVCDKSGIKADGVHTVPRFVAEVTSISTRKQDYTEKMAVYGEIGVQEYWVLDLQRKSIFRFLFEDDYAPEINWYTSSSAIPVNIFPDLEIDLSSVLE